MKSLFILFAILSAKAAFAAQYNALICTIKDGNYTNRTLTFKLREIVINGENLKIPVVNNLSAGLYNTKNSCNWERSAVTLPIPDHVGLQVKEAMVSGSTIFGNGSTVGGTPGYIVVPGWSFQPKKKYRFWVDQFGIVDQARPTPEDLGY